MSTDPPVADCNSHLQADPKASCVTPCAILPANAAPERPQRARARERVFHVTNGVSHDSTCATSRPRTVAESAHYLHY
ncbi:unnamed protein product, partial [Iphiclides podalirius]